MDGLGAARRQRLLRYSPTAILCHYNSAGWRRAAFFWKITRMRAVAGNSLVLLLLRISGRVGTMVGRAAAYMPLLLSFFTTCSVCLTRLPLSATFCLLPCSYVCTLLCINAEDALLLHGTRLQMGGMANAGGGVRRKRRRR